VTVYRDAAGEWRYRVQAGNWRTIDASEEGFKRRASVMRRAGRRWPGVEVVVEETAS
jgi:hypothetical protein